jgi:toxin ParE1/3/4
MAAINWTAEAEQWLQDIFAYISTDKPKAARRVVEGIYEKAQMLKRFPEIGHRYDRYPDLNIRILLYGHYRIAYLIKPDGNIDILGVFHGALEIDRYLF